MQHSFTLQLAGQLPPTIITDILHCRPIPGGEAEMDPHGDIGKMTSFTVRNASELRGRRGANLGILNELDVGCREVACSAAAGDTAKDNAI